MTSQTSTCLATMKEATRQGSRGPVSALNPCRPRNTITLEGKEALIRGLVIGARVPLFLSVLRDLNGGSGVMKYIIVDCARVHFCEGFLFWLKDFYLSISPPQLATNRDSEDRK